MNIEGDYDVDREANRDHNSVHDQHKLMMIFDTRHTDTITE
jgi:hypothetical protein